MVRWPNAHLVKWPGGQMAGCLHDQMGTLPDSPWVRWPHHRVASLSGNPMVTWLNEPFVLWLDGHLIAFVTWPNDCMNKKLI